MNHKNEGSDTYNGKTLLKEVSELFIYDAWENKIYQADYEKEPNSVFVKISLQAGESCIFATDQVTAADLPKKIRAEGEVHPLDKGWERSLCRSKEYPAFQKRKAIEVFTNVGEEEPDFSGFICYENQFTYAGNGRAEQAGSISVCYFCLYKTTMQ